MSWLDRKSSSVSRNSCIALSSTQPKMLSATWTSVYCRSDTRIATRHETLKDPDKMIFVCKSSIACTVTTKDQSLLPKPHGLGCAYVPWIKTFKTTRWSRCSSIQGWQNVQYEHAKRKQVILRRASKAQAFVNRWIIAFIISTKANLRCLW